MFWDGYTKKPETAHEKSLRARSIRPKIPVSNFRNFRMSNGTIFFTRFQVSRPDRSRSIPAWTHFPPRITRENAWWSGRRIKPLYVEKFNVPVKSKLKHPPRATPRAFQLLDNFWKIEKLFKCPIIGPFQVIKCLHPRETKDNTNGSWILSNTEQRNNTQTAVTNMTKNRMLENKII